MAKIVEKVHLPGYFAWIKKVRGDIDIAKNVERVRFP